MVLLGQSWLVPCFSLSRQAPTTATEEFEKGRQAYDQRDYPEAVKHFYAASPSMDSDPNLHYYLANALSFAGHDQESRKEYLKCIEVAPASNTAALARVALFGQSSPPLDFHSNWNPARRRSTFSQSQSSFGSLFGSQYPIGAIHSPRRYSGSYSNPQVYTYQPYTAPSPSPVTSNNPDGQSVRQFIRDLNDQLSDRKRLAMSESLYSPYYRTMELGSFTPFYNARGHFHRGWGDPYSRPTYSRYLGSRAQFGYTDEQRSLAFEQAAAGLESQLLNNTGGVRFNPRGSNLYVRYYGSGIVPVWQPEPIVELLAKQEKLVIDEPASQRQAGKGSAAGAKNAAQVSP
ncbi:MAG: hypothetical protein C5B53_07180 [Candidatus Melainabacteria bacterium]|nr:MAG: hypothetical protein C5B53_07180 [Candidatus Melainabacteria bacterium]